MKNAFDVQTFITFFNAIYGPHLDWAHQDTHEEGFRAEHLTALSLQREHFKGHKFSIYDQAGMIDFLSTGKNNENVFFKLGVMYPSAAQHKGRGGRDQTFGSPAIFADVDLEDGTHAPLKGDRAHLHLATLDEAMAIVKGLPYQPTVIVHSGGGLHLYWRLNDHIGPANLPVKDAPGTFKWDEDKNGPCEDFPHRFENMLIDAFQTKHYVSLDPHVVTSWAQAPRLPGSLNVKDPANPKPVRILELNTENEIDPWKVRDELPPRPAPEPVSRTHMAASLKTRGSAKIHAARGKTARKFEESVPASYLMENVWGMRPVMGGRWALPRANGTVNPAAGHAGLITTANGKVERAVAYGSRLQEVWGVGGHDESVSSWDLMLCITGSEFMAETIAKLNPKPTDELIEMLLTQLDETTTDDDSDDIPEEVAEHPADEPGFTY